MQIIDGKTHQQLLQIVKAKFPREAVGLLLANGEVVELTNTSVTDNQFQINRTELLELLVTNEIDIYSATLWHSHPKGGVGPSRIDMQNKTVFPYHLVVSLANDDLVYTWY